MERVNGIKLGDDVEDVITGVRGIVIGRSEWLTGCATIGIQPKADKNGSVPEVFWVDETRVDTYDGERKLSVVGGPQPTPQTGR